MLYPNFYFKSVASIPSSFFVEHNIKTVLIDLDDTLAPSRSKIPQAEVVEWIQQRKNEGLKLMIFSNNKRERVKDFAIRVKLPFFSQVKKPRQKLFKKIKERELDNICMIGDQVFTDVLGGNLAGLITILVEPNDENRRSFGTAIKRLLEKPFRRRKELMT